MFKHAILCNHMLGQKKLGVEKTPAILGNYLLNNINNFVVCISHYIAINLIN